MEDRVRVKVQIKPDHIVRFQMYHTYFSLTGIMMAFLALLSAYALVDGPEDQNLGITLLFVFILAWCVIITPVNLYLKAIKQSKTVELFKNPMEFEVSSKGIGIYQGGKSGECGWKEITKVVFQKKVAIFYMGKVRANLLPMDQIPDQADEVVRIVKKYATGRIVGAAK